MQVVFAREYASDELFSELAPLLAEHYEEIARFKDIPLAPSWEMYAKREEENILRAFIARDVDAENKIVGYAIFFVTHNLHYSTSRQALQDILFIQAGYRKARLGLRLLTWCDEELQREGVQVVMHHVKVAHPALGHMLESLGYEHVDSVYARRLEDGNARL